MGELVILALLSPDTLALERPILDTQALETPAPDTPMARTMLIATSSPDLLGTQLLPGSSCLMEIAHPTPPQSLCTPALDTPALETPGLAPVLRMGSLCLMMIVIVSMRADRADATLVLIISLKVIAVAGKWLVGNGLGFVHYRLSLEWV